MDPLILCIPQTLGPSLTMSINAGSGKLMPLLIPRLRLFEERGGLHVRQ